MRSDGWIWHTGPRRTQSRGTRREHPTGVIVVHTAENAPDTLGDDQGAENVARFIATRTTAGSYHSIVDTGSIVHLVDLGAEAFHVRWRYRDQARPNGHMIGLSFATRAAAWGAQPAEWVEAIIAQGAAEAARIAAWLAEVHGVEVPARRVTREQALAGVPGFVTHGDLDPGRRSDPGAGFPWTRFLQLFDGKRRRVEMNEREVMADSGGVDGLRRALGRLAEANRPELVPMVGMLWDVDSRGVDRRVVAALMLTAPEVNRSAVAGPMWISGWGGLPPWDPASSRENVQALVDRVARLAGQEVWNTADPRGGEAFQPAVGRTVGGLEAGWPAPGLRQELAALEVADPAPHHQATPQPDDAQQPTNEALAELITELAGRIDELEERQETLGNVTTRGLSDVGDAIAAMRSELGRLW